MKIVIDLPDEVYEEFKAGRPSIKNDCIISDAVFDGKVLPKGHGRLKDIDKIISDGISKGFCEWYDEMKYAPTIIEADKEENT